MCIRDRLLSTCCAFRRAFAALCQKCLACGRIKRIFNGTVAQISQLPLIQNIKVTGIKASVTFYGKIMSTGTGGSAGGRRHSQQDTQIVLKIANADIIASLQLDVYKRQVLECFIPSRQSRGFCI